MMKTTSPEEFIQVPSPTIERAIVYPHMHKQAAWDELRYSIRSIEKNFDDKECPIFIFGTQIPAWMLNNGRVKFFDCWTYQDCLTRGTQAAKKVLWMNDDILTVKPCGWSDFETSRYRGVLNHNHAMKLLKSNNRWASGLGRAILSLEANGVSSILNFSTHIPYIYESDKALEIFKSYGVWSKMVLETIYFNHFKTPNIPIGDFMTRNSQFGESTILNYTDGKLTEEMKDAIKAEFSEPCRFELK